MRHTSLLLPLAAIALATGGPVRAGSLAIVEGRDLDVTAERLEVDVERGTAALRGNVAVALGDLEIRCQEVDLRYDRSPRVSWARGTGGIVARLRGIEATAASMELDAGARALRLEGGVRVTHGRGWATAGRATLDLRTGKVTLDDVRGSIPVGTTGP